MGLRGLFCMIENPITCPQCKSTKIKFKCCGKRRCEDCQYKWSVKRVHIPPTKAEEQQNVNP